MSRDLIKLPSTIIFLVMNSVGEYHVKDQLMNARKFEWRDE